MFGQNLRAQLGGLRVARLLALQAVNGLQCAAEITQVQAGRNQRQVGDGPGIGFRDRLKLAETRRRIAFAELGQRQFGAAAGVFQLRCALEQRFGFAFVARQELGASGQGQRPAVWRLAIQQGLQCIQRRLGLARHDPSAGQQLAAGHEGRRQFDQLFQILLGLCSLLVLQRGDAGQLQDVGVFGIPAGQGQADVVGGLVVTLCRGQPGLEILGLRMPGSRAFERRQLLPRRRQIVLRQQLGEQRNRGRQVVGLGRQRSAIGCACACAVLFGELQQLTFQHQRVGVGGQTDQDLVRQTRGRCEITPVGQHAGAHHHGRGVVGLGAQRLLDQRIGCRFIAQRSRCLGCAGLQLGHRRHTLHFGVVVQHQHLPGVARCQQRLGQHRHQFVLGILAFAGLREFDDGGHRVFQIQQRAAQQKPRFGRFGLGAQGILQLDDRRRQIGLLQVLPGGDQCFAPVRFRTAGLQRHAGDDPAVRRQHGVAHGVAGELEQPVARVLAEVGSSLPRHVVQPHQAKQHPQTGCRARVPAAVEEYILSQGLYL